MSIIPVSLYAATKRSNELMSEAYAKLYGMEQVGLRFFTVYGPWGRPDMAYWTFTRDIIEGRPIKVFNNGELERDFTWIDDIVSGVVATAMQAPATPQPLHRVYNIGNNRPVQLGRFIEIIEEAVGKPAERIMLPMQAGRRPRHLRQHRRPAARLWLRAQHQAGGRHPALRRLVSRLDTNLNADRAVIRRPRRAASRSRRTRFCGVGLRVWSILIPSTSTLPLPTSDAPCASSL